MKKWAKALTVWMSVIMMGSMVACGNPSSSEDDKSSKGSSVESASHQEDTYTLTYDANGGEILSTTQTVTYGEYTYLSTPYREGYTFLGWYFGNIKVQDSVWVLREDITLVAKWEKQGGDSGGNSGGGNNGGGNNGGNDFAVVPYDGSAVTVTFYHTMGQMLREVLNKHIEKFNELYPNITIDHSTKGDYPGVRDQIRTELNNGRAPTMAYCYPDHVALYNTAKATVPLDGYINSTATVTTTAGFKTFGLTAAQQADFVEAYYNEGAAYGDGHMYTLPVVKSTEVMYYNKTAFEQNGWKVPTTWDEMEDLCEVIEKTYPYDIPFGYEYEADWFITMCEQYGAPYTSATGEHFLFDNQQAWDFAAKFDEWYEKGYFTTEELNGGYTTSMFTTTDSYKSKIYMDIGTSAGASYLCPDLIDGTVDQYPFEVGVAMIPQVNPENPKTMFRGPSVCLFKQDNPQEVAAGWLFMKYLATNVEFQAEFSMVSGYAPVIKSVEENSVYKDFLASADGNAWLQVTALQQAIAQKDAMFISPAFNGSSDVRDKVGLMFKEIFVNSPSEGQTRLDFVKSWFTPTINTLRFDWE